MLYRRYHHLRAHCPALGRKANAGALCVEIRMENNWLTGIVNSNPSEARIDATKRGVIQGTVLQRTSFKN